MRTLITGASGSGTSTLARSVGARLQIAVLDADDYFWLPTSPPYVSKREPQQDEGRLEGRSRPKHERWLAARRCAVVRIDGEVAVAESTQRVVESIHKSRAEARPTAR